MVSPNVSLAGTGEALDESLNRIISEFKLREYETQVARSTATQLRLRPGEGSQKEIRTYGKLTGFDVPDGVDLAFAQQLSDSADAYAPGEVGVQVVLAGSLLRRTADRQIMANTGKNMMLAWETKQDTDGVGQYPSFTSTGIGSANTVFSPGHIEAAGGVLSVGNSVTSPHPAPQPWYMVIHPFTAIPLRGRIMGLGDTPAGTTAFGAAGGAHAGVALGPPSTGAIQQRLMMQAGMLGQYAGFIIKTSANIPVDGSGDAVGAAYSRDGYVYVSEVDPRMDPDSSDKSMRGAVELNAWGAYVFGLYLAATLGNSLTFDASTPSS